MPWNVATTVSPKRPAGSGRTSMSAPSSPRKRPRPAPDLVHALGRVRAAIRCSRGARGPRDTPAGRRRRPRGAHRARDPRSIRSPGSSSRAVYRPCRLLSCRDRARGRDPHAGGPQRLPARAGGQAGGRDRPATDLVRPARSGSPRARPARRRGAGPRLARSGRRHRDLDPAPAGGPRGGPRRSRRPSFVGPGALDRDLPVGRRGTGPDHHRGCPRAGRARRVAVEDRAADRRPGATARALGRTDRGSPRDSPAMDPRRGPAGAGHLDLRDQRQVDRVAAHHPHPAAGRAACRDHDLGRRPDRRADDRTRRLDRAGRGAAGAPPVRHRRRRPRDRPRRDRPAGHGLRVERRVGADQRLVRSSRPAGHPHAARAGRGEVDDLPRDEAIGLGRAQRRRPARGRGRTTGARPRRVLHAGDRRAAGRRTPPRRQWRPCVRRPRRLADRAGR